MFPADLDLQGRRVHFTTRNHALRPGFKGMTGPLTDLKSCSVFGIHRKDVRSTYRPEILLYIWDTQEGRPVHLPTCNPALHLGYTGRTTNPLTDLKPRSTFGIHRKDDRSTYRSETLLYIWDTQEGRPVHLST
jgi:hypothetical protein